MTAPIANRLQAIHTDIDDIARQCGRSPADIKLIAVSKRKPAIDIVAAYDCGQRLFGENTVQEARDKIPEVNKTDIDWHFIGHLQKNKAKYIPGLFQWLHALDSINLAEKLSAQCKNKNVMLNTLIQVNVSRDPNKQGLAPEQLPNFIEDLLQASLYGIELKGLMTIGLQTGDQNKIQASFADLKLLQQQCQERLGLPGFSELSMGMSGDYALAIREGATMVRVGSAIFGERDQS